MKQVLNVDDIVAFRSGIHDKIYHLVCKVVAINGNLFNGLVLEASPQMQINHPVGEIHYNMGISLFEHAEDFFEDTEELFIEAITKLEKHYELNK